MPQLHQSFWLDAGTNDNATPQTGQRRVRVGSSVGLLAIVAAVVVAFSGRLHAQEEPRGEALRQLERRLDQLERDNKAIREENARLLQQKDATPKAAPENLGGATPGLTLPTPPPVQTQPGVPPAPTIPDAAQPVPDQNPSAFDPSLIDQLVTRYKGGFVLVESADPESVPFQLVARNFAQFRYTNTQLDSLTFVDHLGNVRPVNPRNDFSFNRDLLSFSGYAFDPRMQYNVVIWGSGSLGSVVIAGGITYEFSKAFILTGGYNGLPGSRSMIGTFRDQPGPDRSMADTFFRPGFTQGFWATGEPLENLFYNLMIGNSLNTLNIGTAKIDTNMTYSGSVWWEPLGNYGPGEAYNDLEKHSRPVVRLGSSFTASREDRFSDTSNSAPDNIQIHNSDGVLFFSTGALAPGVTVELANYYMWAIDAGFKYQGLALNGQYYLRWLNSFRADGPLPINSIFDHGFESSAGYFFHPKIELYGRTSFVFGQFHDSYEYCWGFNYYPFANRGLRIVGEVGRVEHSPVGNIITPYQAGMTGWMTVLQAQLNF
ncbi:MAG: hypothetical protein ACJ8F7_07050 [Gemmataceae bacterium]